MPVAEVPAERDAEVGDPVVEGGELFALLGREAVSGAPDVAKPQVDRLAAQSVEGCRIVGAGVGEDRGRQVVAPGQTRPPLLGALLGSVRRVPDRRIGVDVADARAHAIGRQTSAAAVARGRIVESNVRGSGALTTASIRRSASASAASVASVTVAGDIAA